MPAKQQYRIIAQGASTVSVGMMRVCRICTIAITTSVTTSVHTGTRLFVIVSSSSRSGREAYVMQFVMFVVVVDVDVNYLGLLLWPVVVMMVVAASGYLCTDMIIIVINKDDDLCRT
jgi:hypothetical protein